MLLLESQSNVPFHTQVWIENWLLKEVTDAFTPLFMGKKKFTCIDFFKPDNASEKGRLSTATRAENRNDFIGPNFEIQTIEHHNLLE